MKLQYRGGKKLQTEGTERMLLALQCAAKQARRQAADMLEEFAIMWIEAGRRFGKQAENTRLTI